MPQFNWYCLIIRHLLFSMSTVLQYKNNQTATKSVSLVESDAKNALPTRITALDMVGLTWIFQDEDLEFMRDC